MVQSYPSLGTPLGSVVLGREEKRQVFVFVLEFYDPVNNEVMSSRSVNSGTVPGQA